MSTPKPWSAKTLFEVHELVGQGWDLKEAARDRGVAEDLVGAFLADLAEWSKPTETDDGQKVFEAVKKTLKAHVYFESDWAYDIAALYVLQAELAEDLPAVFYIFAGGQFGAGKTRIINVLKDLTGGAVFENVSVAALAHGIKRAVPVYLDEVDIPRGKEYDEVRDALLRQGYRADAAPYVRHDPKAGVNVPIPVYSPKGATYRSALDPALESRGFLLPAVRAEGEVGYDFVLKGLWPETAQTRKEVEAWGKTVTVPSERLREIASSDEFRAKVHGILGSGMGANRDSELVTIALLVCEVSGVQVDSSIRAALDHKAALSGTLEANEVAELLDALRHYYPERVVDVGGEKVLRVSQADVKATINLARRDRRELPMSDRRMALVRREAGIKDRWLRSYHGARVWLVPVNWCAENLGASEVVAENAQPVSPSESNAHIESYGENGSNVSHVSLSEGVEKGGPG